MNALVLGGGSCVWGGVAGSEALLGPDWWDIVVAANDIGVTWPRRLDHWCSLHSNKLDKWRAERLKRGLPGPAVTWARKGKKCRGIDREVAQHHGGGSSGLLAVNVARAVGADRIILCGVPMTKTPYFAESVAHPQGRSFSSADSHWKRWKSNAAEIGRYTRSMSGRTRDLLGAPTVEWLARADAA